MLDVSSALPRDTEAPAAGSVEDDLSPEQQPLLVAWNHGQWATIAEDSPTTDLTPTSAT